VPTNVVAAYIAKQPRAAQVALRRVRSIVRKQLPDAEETISYQIPTYKRHGQYVVYFAGWKHHWSLYPVTKTVQDALGPQLQPYRISKGTVRFPLTEPVPTKLVERIVRVLGRAAAARQRAKSKSTTNKGRYRGQGLDQRGSRSTS
jgi:uncharacterized protein YdhG (YjbR/CyaY superfamily)